MTIEIQQPEVEALISRLMGTGRFDNVEDALLHALRTSPLPSVTANLESDMNRPKGRLKLDPPLIPPAGRVIQNLTNEQVYELIEFP
jgi:hypothetical protein